MTNIFYSIDSLSQILKKEKSSKVCLVTSKILYRKLSWAINKINIPKSQIVFIPDGEEAKTWKTLQNLLGKFSRMNLDRSSIVIALGGGSVGDVTGFAASIYLRGIKYVQIPTTLLAQVDSAHGGKTGVNFLKFKNQIGSFQLPIAIVIEMHFMKSLSVEQIIDGLGEIIKAGFIKDPSILSLLKKHKIKELVQSQDFLKIIKKSIAVKNYFTRKDLRDNKLRQILNVGHTIGHAIELKYKISHGKAVIIGMFQELELAESLGLTPPSVRKNLENLLKQLDIKINTKLEADKKTILHDKKVSANMIYFPIIVSEGKAKLIKLNLEILKKVTHTL